MGDIDGFFKPEQGTQFPSYMTALNLAAQKNQYVIVQLLLQRGELISRYAIVLDEFGHSTEILDVVHK